MEGLVSRFNFGSDAARLRRPRQECRRLARLLLRPSQGRWYVQPLAERRTKAPRSCVSPSAKLTRSPRRVAEVQPRSVAHRSRGPEEESSALSKMKERLSFRAE